MEGGTIQSIKKKNLPVQISFSGLRRLVVPCVVVGVVVLVIVVLVVLVVLILVVVVVVIIVSSLSSRRRWAPLFVIKHPRSTLQAVAHSSGGGCWVAFVVLWSLSSVVLTIV